MEIDIAIKFEPDKAALSSVGEWMRAENDLNGPLQHDLSVIANHFRDNTLGLIYSGIGTIGFIAWTIEKRVAYISHLSIHPDRRGNGLGKRLFEELLDRLSRTGIMAVHLMCAPKESATFWRKCGFKDMPTIPGISDHGSPCLFRTTSAAQENGRSEKIQLTMHKYGEDAIASWPVQIEQGTNLLIKPIIAPAYGDWILSLQKNNEHVQQQKVKYFGGGKCFESPFLLITELDI